MKILTVNDNSATLTIYPRYYGYNEIEISIRDTYGVQPEILSATYLIDGHLLQLEINDWLPVLSKPYSVIVYDVYDDSKRVVWMGNAKSI